MYRIFANILVLLSFFLLPFWCTIIVAIVVSLFFDFIEIVFYGFLFDLLYGIPGSFVETNLFTISAVTLYGIILLIKPYIKL
ncbi:MAG: hypothetical protein V4469_00835 [Patescibacteria group bacterium]